MVSKLLLVFRIAVILFPTVAGVLLTSFGAGKLNEAYIVPSVTRTNPYGFLVFSTMTLPKGNTAVHFWINDIVLDERAAGVLVHCESLVNPPATGEQVLGFQIPYFCDLLNFSMGKPGEFEVSKVDTVHLEDQSIDGKTNTTLIYATFSSPQQIEKCTAELLLNWKGLVTKESFSEYAISIPLADSQGDTHEKVSEYCPNASSYFEAVEVKIAVQTPKDCQYRGSIIPPVQELARTTGDKTLILWEIVNPNAMATPDTTYYFTMSLENNVEAELRDHLLFDSGLYMGLGVSLIFGGLFEAVKIGTDIARERRKIGV